VQLRPSWKSRVDCWRFTNVSANTAFAIFKVNICGCVSEPFTYLAVRAKWEVIDVIGTAEVLCSPNHILPPTQPSLQDLYIGIRSYRLNCSSENIRTRVSRKGYVLEVWRFLIMVRHIVFFSREDGSRTNYRNGVPVITLKRWIKSPPPPKKKETMQHKVMYCLVSLHLRWKGFY
jgi:hypothetical protein